MRKKEKKFCAFALTLALALQGIPAAAGLTQVSASYADNYSIPSASSSASVGATMPYTRYDSMQASLGGSAAIATGYNMDRYAIASQASERSYVRLPGNGAYAEWKVNQRGRGVTMRFTMPDSSDGYGISGSLDVYVNGSYKKTVNLSSYYMWQYFAGGNPSDTNDGGPGAFAFDEVHFLLDDNLNAGDTIRIQSTGASGVEYGVDFLEIEEVESAISQPANSLSVTDYGAVANDGNDDYSAIVNCVNAANSQGKTVYFPAGTFQINQIWSLNASNIKITGAGMWYTNIQFTNSNASSGGISCNTSNVEFCNMYINSNLRSRYNQNAVYKCFMDILGGGSVVHDVWEEHFECGFWMADYTGQGRYADNLKIVNCRIRNNLADGVNFCQGTSNSCVYNCSIRNNGDDGLAMWNNNYNSVKDESGNIFAYNTIDFIWRAGGIAIYGGNNHKIYNNYISDSFMSAGIHLNTTFDGYKFNNNSGIVFSNNTLVRAGAGKGSWGEEFGAIDIEGNVQNITFNNTKIYDAEHDAIRLSGSGVSKITFNDTVIDGAGIDGQQYNYSSVSHKGCAILAINGCSATFNTAWIKDIAKTDNYYIDNANVALNNVTLGSVPGDTGTETTVSSQTTTTTTTNQTVSASDILLNGTNPLTGAYSVSGSYLYQHYASFNGAGSDYKYLKITYTGDISSLRLETSKGYGTGSESFGSVYWFDGSNNGNTFKTVDGSSINLNGSNTTIVIDLEASGLYVSQWDGVHIHTGNGNTASFTISDARLMTSGGSEPVTTTTEPATTTTTEQITTTTTSEITTTSEQTTTTSEVTTSKIEAVIDGYQISAVNEGIRTIYSVTADESQVAEVGLIYGLKDKISESDMTVSSTSPYVHAYRGSSQGLSSYAYDEGCNSYVMTMKFGNVNTDFYSADLYIRAYIKKKDGSYVYSDINKMSVYSVANVLYLNRRMSNQVGHDYIYNNILKAVNPSYKEVDYNWTNQVTDL